MWEDQGGIYATYVTGEISLGPTSNERLVPDLPRGRGKSSDGDLDIDEEGSKQNFEFLQSLHHCSVGYQFVWHELTLPRRLIPPSTIENNRKNKEDAIWIADEWLSS
jgi:hypothetical protein